MDAPFPAGMVECIERFFLGEPSREPCLDLYEDVFATELFFPLQRQAEMRKMIQLARRVNPRTVMEIGADKGGSLYHWCKCFPDVRTVIACEIRGTPYSKLFEAAFPHIHFLWCGSSRERKYGPTASTLSGVKQIDVLFIDGDKSAFLEDFDAYLPLMNPKGVMFLHDINEVGTGPRRAFDSIRARGFRTERIVDVSDVAPALAKEGKLTPHEGWLRHWRGASCGVGVVWLDGRTK